MYRMYCMNVCLVYHDEIFLRRLIGRAQRTERRIHHKERRSADERERRILSLPLSLSPSLSLPLPLPLSLSLRTILQERHLLLLVEDSEAAPRLFAVLLKIALELDRGRKRHQPPPAELFPKDVLQTLHVRLLLPFLFLQAVDVIRVFCHRVGLVAPHRNRENAKDHGLHGVQHAQLAGQLRVVREVLCECSFCRESGVCVLAIDSVKVDGSPDEVLPYLALARNRQNLASAGS